MRKFYAVLVIFLIWLLLESGIRLYVGGPLKTDFYSSIPRELVPDRQKEYGVQVTSGSDWIHLGWIANPDIETYIVNKYGGDGWRVLGRTDFGSFLIQVAGEGKFRVVAVSKENSTERILGVVSTSSTYENSPVLIPRISGHWKILFKPTIHGYYINDHTVFQDTEGNWRLVGITDKSDGNYNNEVYFAVGISQDFPPKDGMQEIDPVADYGDLAWAPHVINDGEVFHMFWSPHKLHQMTSENGITWSNHQILLAAPYHKFFRDPIVIQVGENQWLLYTTARGKYFSQIDIYQSFDLKEWQYIRTALTSSFGSERNSPFSSMESPFVIQQQGNYYLSLTYNNNSFFWPGILMLFHIWPNPESYNDTLIFHSNNPYDFGTYRGKTRSPSLLTQIEAHAPEYIFNPDTQQWYITTAGWPWVATLTTGEVAIAPLTWYPKP